MSNLFWLTGAQIVRLSPFFPTSHGKPRVDDHRAFSAIISMNHNGLRWRDAPRDYGPSKTCSDGVFGWRPIWRRCVEVLRFELMINVVCVTQPQGSERKRSMKHFAGLDVSVKETSVCIVDETGRICREMKVASHPGDLAVALSDPSWNFVRVGLEAGRCRNGCSVVWRKPACRRSALRHGTRRHS